MTENAIVASPGFAGVQRNLQERIEQIKNYEKAPVTTRARNLTFAALVLGSLFLLGLFAIQVIKGVVAATVTLIFLAVVVYAVRFMRAMDPAVQQKMKNCRIKKMTEEARNNAVAQLDATALDKSTRLAQAREGRDRVKALVLRLQAEVDAADPQSAVYTRKKKMLEPVERNYEVLANNIDTAAAALKTFEAKVDEYKDMDSFARDINEAMGLMGNAMSNKLEDMLSLAAFEQIESDFYTAVAAAENSARDMAVDQAIAA